MGKFSSKGSSAPAPVLSTSTSTSAEEVVESLDDAARRRRLAEKRRRGRRASILSNIGEKEIQSTNINRPGAGALAKTFGG